MTTQDPELNLQTGHIQATYVFETRKNTRNLVIEVLPQIRRQIIQNKLKLQWVICKVDDYMAVNRCFECSGFNHRHKDCKSEEACPLCTGKHRLKDCTASRSDYKCINCMKFKEHSKDRKFQENNTTLDRNCPSLQAMIEKYRQNTNY